MMPERRWKTSDGDKEEAKRIMKMGWRRKLVLNWRDTMVECWILSEECVGIFLECAQKVSE